MRRLRRLALAALGSSFGLAAVACEEGGPPPATPSTQAIAPITTVYVDAGPALSAAASDAPSAAAASAGDAGSAAGGPDFKACAADADCVAVPKVGCCHNGVMEAVNKGSVDAYKASFVCPNKRQMCPQFILLDKRVARCAAETHKCAMVEP